MIEYFEKINGWIIRTDVEVMELICFVCVICGILEIKG